MIILIHGAWHGAWVWERVIGPGMVAPELDLAADLSAHVAAIGELIGRSTEPVRLVGHSYGAAVAQLAAARWADRVEELVCLDGFVLRPGQAVIDLVPPRIRLAWLEQGGMVRPLGVDVMAVNDADRDWVQARLRPQSLRCFVERAPEGTGFGGKRFYARASGFAFPPFDRILARCTRDGWECETVATGHDVMLAAPDWVKDRIGARKDEVKG